VTARRMPLLERDAKGTGGKQDGGAKHIYECMSSQVGLRKKFKTILLVILPPRSEKHAWRK